MHAGPGVGPRRPGKTTRGARPGAPRLHRHRRAEERPEFEAALKVLRAGEADGLLAVRSSEADAVADHVQSQGLYRVGERA